VTPWARSCVRAAREGRQAGGISLLAEVVHPSESIVVIIVIILVISPIYVLSHFNQRGAEEAAAGRARLIGAFLHPRGRKSQRVDRYR